jgi:hypothetical protein
MTPRDPYQQWRESRRADQPPERLAERIMQTIEASRVQPAKADRRRSGAWFAPRRRDAVILLAGTAFVLRIAAAFAVFITP